jgi:6,7-dimethyl-8-ribityllumazine synthase
MGRRFKIAIVQAVFHKSELEVMLKAAKQQAQEIELDVVDTRSVPGSMELPIIVDHLLNKAEVDGVVALGIIEKGETAHGRVMADAVVSRLIDIQLRAKKPIGVGILGPEIMPSQIPPRLEGYAKAAVRAVKNVLDQLNP